MKRPQDFFGPEDWIGGDPEADIRRIKAKQAAWDKAYAEQPWWRRFLGLNPK